MINPKPQPKFIHIHAVCPYFEFYEQIEESKSVSRLERIRKLFIEKSKRKNVPLGKPDIFKDEFNTHKLKVKTIVVNPTMF